MAIHDATMSLLTMISVIMLIRPRRVNATTPSF
jgi:hypothetical protein